MQDGVNITTHGGTVNAIEAAVLADGETIIEYASIEPEVDDLINMLNSMGAKIKGAGTDTIKITGVKELNQKSSYSIIPDQIETGTFMVAAAATKGDVVINNCIPKHMEPITAKLIEAGATVEESESSIRVKMDKRPTSISIKTMPYPGFPTDMQPQTSLLLTLGDSTGTIVETIWESRFQYTDELNKMGADITAHGSTAIFKGVEKLYGAPVKAHSEQHEKCGPEKISAQLLSRYDSHDAASPDHVCRI